MSGPYVSIVGSDVLRVGLEIADNLISGRSRLEPTISLRQALVPWKREIHSQFRDHFDRLPIEQRRPVHPMADRILSSGDQ